MRTGNKDAPYESQKAPYEENAVAAKVFLRDEDASWRKVPSVRRYAPGSPRA